MSKKKSKLRQNGRRRSSARSITTVPDITNPDPQDTIVPNDDENLVTLSSDESPDDDHQTTKMENSKDEGVVPDIMISSISGPQDSDDDDIKDEQIVPSQKRSMSCPSVLSVVGKRGDREVPFLSIDDQIKEEDEDQEEEPVVVLRPKPKPNTLLIKHPLQYCWTFWYYRAVKNLSWNENLVNVIDFDTAEDFWSIMNRITSPSCLMMARDYNVFKQGIRPEWEDCRNVNGGKWSITSGTRGRFMDFSVDDAWKEILMCMIGEGFEEYSQHICGISYSARKQQDRISVWIDCDYHKNKEQIIIIGRTLRRTLEYVPGHEKIILEYCTNADWANKKSSSAAARITM